MRPKSRNHIMRGFIMAQKKPAPVKKKKKSPAKKADNNAVVFLCITLAVIIIAVCAVCVSVNKHNTRLAEKGTESNAAQSTEAETEAESTAASSDVSEEATEAESNEDTTAEETEAAEEPTEKANEKPAETTKSSIGSLPTPQTLNITDDNWNMTLINIRYRMPEDYTPDLVYVCGSEERLDSRVAQHYEEMYNAAAKDGVYLTPCSGYRSYELQNRNFNREKDYFLSQGYTDAESEVLAAQTIMPPGSSEHNLGLAMDIVCVDEWFEDTDEFAWLTAHAADYGFIMRYPADKQDITKVIYEPWHWRYVGVEKAKEIKASGLVLEEFLGDVG